MFSYKKLIIISLLILTLLMGAVNAANETTTQPVAANDNAGLDNELKTIDDTQSSIQSSEIQDASKEVSNTTQEINIVNEVRSNSNNEILGNADDSNISSSETVLSASNFEMNDGENLSLAPEKNIEILGASDEHNVLRGNIIEFYGTTSTELKQAIDSAAEGDIIRLNNDVESDVKFTTGKVITIDGNGHTYDFKNLNVDNYIRVSKNVNFYNLTFINLGGSSSYKYYIYADSYFRNNLNFYYCNFVGLDTNMGCAIQTEKCSVNIVNCTFRHFDSAVCCIGGNITNSTIEYTDYAIMRVGDSYDRTSFNMDNCIIQYNDMSYQYAIGLVFYTVDVNITNTVFLHNKMYTIIDSSVDAVEKILNISCTLKVGGYMNAVQKSYMVMSFNLKNDTYWNGTDIVNSDDIFPILNSGGVNFTLEITDTDGKLVRNTTYLTDWSTNRFIFDYSKMKTGSYNYKVYINEDDYHTTAVSSGTFTNIREELDVNVNPISVLYGENSTIFINGNFNLDYEGDVIAYIGGTSFTNRTKAENGEFTVAINLNPDDLIVKNYDITINVVGDDDFEGFNKIFTNYLTVNPVSPNIRVVAHTIGAGQDANISFILPDSATGTVRLKVGNIVDETLNTDQPHYYIVDGSLLSAGVYDVSVEYAGDSNYLSDSATTSLYVERPHSYVNATYLPVIYYGQTQNIIFTIYTDEALTNVADCSGTIRVYGGNKISKVITVNEGQGICELDDLTVGNYSIIAIYSGDDAIGGSDCELEFAVKGINTTLIITPNQYSVDVEDNLIITVEINNTINDVIQLFVDNTLYCSNSTVDGVTSFVLYNLTYGDHNISAVFNGDSIFENASNSTIVTVNRVNVNPDINVTCNRDIVFDINVPDDVTGQIRIKGNGTDEIIPVVNGNVNLTIANPLRGDYKFNISYEGNWKYLPFDIEKTFTVSDVDDYVLNITSTTAEFNKTVNIEVIAFSDLEGKTINLVVDGTTHSSANVINGVATFDNVYLVSNTTGEFEIIASYDGDNTYAAKSFSTMVPIIPTSDYTIGLKALEIVTVGDNILINITAPSLINSLNITVNGKTQLITRDNFTYHIDDIDEGEYVVMVSYAGDKAYASKTNTTIFNVVKNNLTITLNDITGDIFVDSPVTFTATLNEIVTGTVIFNINGVNYTSIVNNADTASYIYTPVNNDTLSVFATFVGNDKFNANSSAVKEFDVSKVASRVSLSDVTIEVGEVAEINQCRQLD